MPFEDTIEEFKEDLPNLNTSAILTKYVYAGQCACLSDAQHGSLKERISGRFEVGQEDIVVVGSAKMGFSLASHKRYRPFNDSSDIDVAIISPALYTRFWYELFDYQRSGSYWKDSKECEHYCFRGWIRPDKLPRSDAYPLSKRWWDFFQALTSGNQYGPYKITGALYHSRHFFDAYQRLCIDQCKQELGV